MRVFGTAAAAGAPGIAGGTCAGAGARAGAGAGAAGRPGIVAGTGFDAGTTARSIRGGMGIGTGMGAIGLPGIGGGGVVTGGSDGRAASHGSIGPAPSPATASTAHQLLTTRTRFDSRCDFMTRPLLVVRRHWCPAKRSTRGVARAPLTVRKSRADRQWR